MLKTFVVLFLLPPINLVVLAAVGLILTRFKLRLGLAVTTIAVVALLLCSMHAVSHPLLGALERNLPTEPRADAPPTAIVVLAGDVARSPSVPGGVTVGPMTLQRLRTAATLQRRTGLPILVSGGALSEGPSTHASLMVDSLEQDFRVPVRWTEGKSINTWENAMFSAEILRAEGIRSVYLVTHAWHMRRSLVAFAAFGITATAAPTPRLTMLDFIPSDFIPSVTSWMNTYYAFHEWIGGVWYGAR